MTRIRQEYDTSMTTIAGENIDDRVKWIICTIDAVASMTSSTAKAAVIPQRIQGRKMIFANSLN